MGDHDAVSAVDDLVLLSRDERVERDYTDVGWRFADEFRQSGSDLGEHQANVFGPRHAGTSISNHSGHIDAGCSPMQQANLSAANIGTPSVA